MKARRSWNNDSLSGVLRCRHAHSPFLSLSRLSDYGARQYRCRALLTVGDVVGQGGFRQLIDHDHLDRVVLRHVVADPHALRTAFAPIHRHLRRAVLEPSVFPQFIAIENGIGLRAILRAELTALCRTDFNADIGYEI